MTIATPLLDVMHWAGLLIGDGRAEKLSDGTAEVISTWPAPALDDILEQPHGVVGRIVTICMDGEQALAAPSRRA